MVKNKKFVFCIFIILMMSFLMATVSNAAESAKCFGNSACPSAADSTGYAVYGFQRLGYTTYSAYGGITRSAMLDWIHTSSNNYGFYVQTFGGDGYFNDHDGISVHASDITGNWHLVFIDCSDSAASTTLANAFKIYGYSNRGFLGWSNDVYSSSTRMFNYYLWTDFVTSVSIRQAAVNAAALVPGSGTTPIRFYGDSSWMGYAS